MSDWNWRRRFLVLLMRGLWRIDDMAQAIANYACAAGDWIEDRWGLPGEIPKSYCENLDEIREWRKIW